ncbi:MAG: hypothetical protein QY326_06410 [Bdellovibrionota bacterium]|nr:MAG: hypothetical protein QY326_06410 [Bdellovibrionota bacterium]
MNQVKKQKYLTKTVKFGGKTLTLFSIDGAVWSSRKDELTTIQERHEAERQKLAQLKPEENSAEEETKSNEEEGAGSNEAESDDGVVIMSAVSDDEDDRDEKPKAKKGKTAPSKIKPAKPSMTTGSKKQEGGAKAPKKSKPVSKVSTKKKKRAA